MGSHNHTGARIVISLAVAVGGWKGTPLNAQTSAIDPAQKKLLGAEGLLARGQYDLARQEFDEFLKMYPQDAHLCQARYDRALSEFNLNDAPAAIADLTAVIGGQTFSKRDEAISLLGTLYLQKGQLQKTVATLDALMKEYPQSPQVESAQVNRAQALYRLGRFEDSLNAVRDLLKTFPKSGYRASALYVGAIDQRNLGDEKEAERTLREVVSAYPNSPFVYDAQLLIGESLAAQGRPDDAVAHYRQLEAEAPESRKAAIRFGLGAALLRGGKFADAEKTFNGIIQTYPASTYAPPATLQRAVAQLKAGRRDDARASLAAATAHYPQLAPSAAYWLARCDLLDGKYDQAAIQLERLAGGANTDIPERPEIEFDLAYCQLRLGHDAIALQRLETFRAKYPHSTHSPEALYYEASALYGLGQFAKSAEFCEAVEKYPQTSVQREAAMLKGEDLLMLGQFSKADAVFGPLEQSSLDEDERHRLLFRRGQSSYFAGDYAGAETRLAEVVKNAMRGDPAVSEAIFLLGDAQLQQGKNAQAEATLKDYITATRGQTPPSSAGTNRLEEATFKLATAQEHLKEEGAAAETLRSLMNSASGDLKSPWAQRAWFEYGQLAFQRGDVDGATTAIPKLLTSKPDGAIAAPALYLLARIEMQLGKNDAAAEHLDQLVRSYPTDSLTQDSAFVRGVALKNAHHPEQAERQFATYLQSFPNGKYLTEARHQQAVALTSIGKPQTSADAARMLADLANGSARNESVLYDLAWAYRGNDDQPKAVATYQTLLKEYPAGAQATPARVELAQILYEKKQYAEAMALLTQAVADVHADPHLHAVAVYWAASCAARLGDDAGAARMFDAFVAGNARDPLVPAALGEAGAAYANLKKFDESEQRERRVMAEFSGTDAAILAMIRLGEAQNQAEDYAAAADTFTKWLADHEQSPLAARAHFGIGWSLENRGKLEEARAQYVQVIATDNGELGARAQFQTGETWFAEKRYDTAAKELLKVDIIYTAPQWAARALYEAGRAFEELKQPARAQQQFEACIHKYKDSDVAALARQRLGSQ